MEVIPATRTLHDPNSKRSVIVNVGSEAETRFKAQGFVENLPEIKPEPLIAPEPPVLPDLQSLTKRELVELAAEYGLEIDFQLSKEKILAEIRQHVEKGQVPK